MSKYEIRKGFYIEVIGKPEDLLVQGAFKNVVLEIGRIIDEGIQTLATKNRAE